MRKQMGGETNPSAHRISVVLGPEMRHFTCALYADGGIA